MSGNPSSSSSIFVFIALSILPVVAAGCTAPPSEPAESAEGAETVHPEDTANRATVTLRLPASFVTEVPSLGARFNFWFNGTWVAPGTPTKVVPRNNPGNWGCLQVTLDRSAQSRVAEMTECIWQAAPDAQVTVDLSVLKLWWAGNPQSYSPFILRGAGGRPRLARIWQGAPFAKWSSNGTYYGLVGRNDIALPVVPGTYHYDLVADSGVSAVAPQVFEVPPGAQLDRDVSFNDHLARLSVLYADREGFPDAQWDQGVRVDCGDDRHTFASRGATLSIPVVVARKDATACSYQVGTSFDGGSIELKPGVDARVELRRLNVADVVLTDEGGAVARGRYTVTSGGKTFEGTTNTGIDVPPGSYHVVVSYAVNGSPRRQSYDVNL